MKKLFAMVAVATALLFAGNVNAQTGVHIGYSPETWTTVDNNGNSSTLELTTVFAGVDYDVPITGGLNLNIGGQLRYGTESGEQSFYGLASGKHTTTLVGVDVPLLFNYGLDLGSLRLTFFAGPKVSFGVLAKTKYEQTVAFLGSSTNEVDWYNADGMNRNRLNVSGTFGLALGFQQFRLFGGYNYGFLDMDNSSNTKTTIGGVFFGLGMTL